MAVYDERIAYINEMAEAKGYGQDYVDLLKNCAEWAGDNQWEQIREGLENGIDVSVYADPKFESRQMWQIRWGLENDLDVSKCADPKFDWLQMQQILVGLVEGLDVSEYADPNISADEMGDIRYELEQEYRATH